LPGWPRNFQQLEIEGASFKAFSDFTHRHQAFKVVRQVEFGDEDLFQWYYRQLSEGYVEGLSWTMKAGEVCLLERRGAGWTGVKTVDEEGVRRRTRLSSGTPAAQFFAGSAGKASAVRGKVGGMYVSR
jgi:hypothetical protein